MTSLIIAFVFQIFFCIMCYFTENKKDRRMYIQLTITMMAAILVMCHK